MRKILFTAALIGLVFAGFTGCGGETGVSGQREQFESTVNSDGAEDTSVQEKTGEQIASVEFTDALGYELKLTAQQRIAVLSESLADAWLLAGGELAASTQDAKAVVPKDTVIAGTLKNPSFELLIAQDIDCVILSSSIAEHVNMRESLESAGIQTAYFEVETFNEYLAMMKIFTDITGREDLYQKNGEDIRVQIEEQIERQNGSTPRVLFLRAYSGGINAKGSDSMVGRMLQDLGCRNIADSRESLLQNLSMEEVRESDPDFIFVTTMGESPEGALAMVEKLLCSDSSWNDLKAVKENHYFVLPKELFHNKPNKRWAESYRMLADDLYGKQ